MNAPNHVAIAMETGSPRQTQALGKLLGEASQPGDLILLVGELGTGKTCLTQGVAQGLGIQGYVRSPTFVLVTEYHGRLPLYHIDLYRIERPQEALNLGLEEYVEGTGLCVVEWADKAIDLFPSEHLLVELEHRGPRGRTLRFTARGHRYLDLLETLIHKVNVVRASS